MYLLALFVFNINLIRTSRISSIKLIYPLCHCQPASHIYAPPSLFAYSSSMRSSYSFSAAFSAGPGSLLVCPTLLSRFEMSAAGVLSLGYRFAPPLPPTAVSEFEGVSVVGFVVVCGAEDILLCSRWLVCYGLRSPRRIRGYFRYCVLLG